MTKDSQEARHEKIKKRILEDLQLRTHLEKRVSVLPLLEEHSFKEVYEYRDPEREVVLQAIRRESTKWLFGTGLAMGFFIYLAKDR